MANAVTDFVATQATKSTTGQGIAGTLASVAFTGVPVIRPALAPDWVMLSPDGSAVPPVAAHV